MQSQKGEKMKEGIIYNIAKSKIRKLEETLIGDNEYEERQRRINHATEQMAKSNLSDEQNQLVDELVCAHVAQQEYLNVYMYKEGFLDFVELYGEISREKKRIQKTNN